MKTGWIIGLVAVLLLVGCDQKAWFERFIPQDDAEFSRQYLELLQAGNFEAAEAIVDPSLRTDQLRSQLEEVAAFFPPESPVEIQTVGAQTIHGNRPTQVSITLQYSYADQFLLASVVQDKSDQGPVIRGVHVQPIPDALENIHRFTFEDKGAAHYLMLALAIAVPALIVFALVLCIRTSMARRKWLWIIFILLGFTQTTLNWTDGSLHFNAVSVHVLGLSALSASPYSPWLLSVSLPVGAIVFLFRRRQLAASAEEVREAGLAGASRQWKSPVVGQPPDNRHDGSD